MHPRRLAGRGFLSAFEFGPEGEMSRAQKTTKRCVAGPGGPPPSRRDAAVGPATPLHGVYFSS